MASARPDNSQTGSPAWDSEVLTRARTNPLVVKYVAVPLREIEVDGARLLEPASARTSGRAPGVTRQFLEDAPQYHERYTSHGYFRTLIEGALSRCDIRSVSSLLDLGSGSGNSVVPSLELFPQADVVAVDISPHLLAILRKYVDGTRPDFERLLTVCMDAATDIYAPASFDLCIGAAILHHVTDPQEVIGTVMRALKPGGHAFFFEPFEGGNAILRLAYLRVLRSPRAFLLRRAVRALLERMVKDYGVRMDSESTDPRFSTLDDKWMFTRTFFHDVARRVGATSLTIHALHRLDRPFTAQTEANLRLGAGLGPDALPSWAWRIVNEMDEVFSARVKDDLLIEGCVAFRK
jgi:SAM-dependent methyltransferase